jgi:type IV secretion system protein TrbL
MNDLSIIDGFMDAYVRYIDSGFGLLGPDVGFLTRALIGIDITLAGLFWAMGGEQDVLGRFLKKILSIGAFAFILNSFSSLADIVFRSFARAGLMAGGGTLSADDLLRPGKVAATGYQAAWPLLEQVSQMTGFTSFFDNFLTIAVLLFAWAIVILAFFILAVQIFVTIIEFKLTSLAGFILVPFALWNRTGFLAERVLGNVVSCGIKVMVLAVIVGIGAGVFAQFTAAAQAQEPDLAQAMSLTLGALALLGLGVFGPGIASGLVAGAPQLGAGAAIATTIGAAGAVAVGGMAAAGAARLAGGAALGAVRAGTAMGSAARTAYTLGQEAAGSAGVGAGLGGLARAAESALRQRAGAALGLGAAAESGRAAAWAALAGTGRAAQEPAGEATPAWARQLRRQLDSRHRRQLAVQALHEGDRGGAGATPDISEKED